MPALTISAATLDEELAALEEGDRSLVLRFPADWELAPPGASAFQPLTAYTNEANAVPGQTALLIVNAVVAQAIVTAAWSAPLVVVEEVAGRDLAYIDFLVPGILGLTIMQLGLFSVAFDSSSSSRPAPCAACSPRRPRQATSCRPRSARG